MLSISQYTLYSVDFCGNTTLWKFSIVAVNSNNRYQQVRKNANKRKGVSELGKLK